MVVFFRIDETCFEEEFPQGVHLHIAGKTGLLMATMDHDMTQMAVGSEIHIEDSQTVPAHLLSDWPPVDYLGVAGHLQNTCVPDLQVGNDHSRHQHSLGGFFLDGEACECQVENVPLDRFLDEGVHEIG